IRCIDSPYKQTFDQFREKLETENKTRDEIREELELMNLGRLRIASKGLTRAPNKADELSAIAEDKQWSDGMYMIGQVAALHDNIFTIAQLHEDVSAGSVAELRRFQKSPEAATTFGALNNDPVAIIGMSCLFPKASDV